MSQKAAIAISIGIYDEEVKKAKQRVEDAKKKSEVGHRDPPQIENGNAALRVVTVTTLR